MSILLAFAGLVIAVLFAAAGYRATNVVRFQEMRDRIPYHGRIQAFYDSVRQADVLSAASFLKRAVVAKSAPYKSHC
jgi:hypothetical protein